MKTFCSHTLLFILLFFSMTAAFAADFETRALIDKTYVRDNTFCTHNGKKFELEVRSFDQYTTPGDATYGEHVFLLHNKTPVLLPLNKGLMGRYRLLKGEQNNCSKSLFLKTANDRLIFFFLKDSRPFKDTLTLVIYSPHKKAKVVETNYGIISADIEKGILKFSSPAHSRTNEIGRIKIFQKVFVYEQKPLTLWYTYDGKKFEVDLENTYNNFEQKHFFSDSKEFAKSFGWISKTKMFTIKQYSHAVQHTTKENCISIDPAHAVWTCK